MKADIWEIMTLGGIGMLLGVLLTCGVSDFTGPSEGSTEEQVSIQEEEMEVIGMYVPGGISIAKIHDNRDNVTCWMAFSGISCIPDHMLTP